MTFRWRQQDHVTDYELSTRRTRRQPRTDTASDGYTESLSSADSDEAIEKGYGSSLNQPTIGLWQRLLNVMSRAPLISRVTSNGEASYGAVPEHDSFADEDSSSSSQGNGGNNEPPSEPSLGVKDRFAKGDLRDGSESAGEDLSDEGEDPRDNSRYPEVRASVSARDNIKASISTPRMWILSMLCAFLGSGANLFFSLRYPSVAITPIIALVVVHPLGLLWDHLFKRDDDPNEIFDCGSMTKSPSHEQGLAWTSRLTTLRRWLGQGKWNEKEHACVYISSNVSFGFAFATDVIVEQVKFYKQDLSIIYQLALTISTQILGYSFAGLTRRYLVRPPSMIWPATLMSTAMFTTMHKSENKIANGWKFGTRSGLGLFPVTFDWAQIAYIGSPLVTPWWAAANVVAGLIIVMWIVAPIMYYTNSFYSAFLPILSSAVFDNTGKPYDVSRILTPDFLFDREKYDAYSKVYLPITYALAYGVQFAGLSALVTHTACWYGKEIWQVSRDSVETRLDHHQEPSVIEDHVKHTNNQNGHGSRSNSTVEAGINVSMREDDVHARLMRRYEDAPVSWYLATFLAMLAIGIFVVEYYPVYLPWYGLLLALSITAVLYLPVAIVMAITNQHSSLYLVCQLICGVVFPGRPVANMVFTTYCYISSAQGVKFSSDLKLGHYMKIPPKLLFQVQMLATLVSSFTQIGVLNWMFTNIPSLCKPDAINGFTCPLARVHFNGSILWGVVGPQRFFGAGAVYRPLIWFFLLGAIAPIVVFMIGRKKPLNSIWRKINLPVLFGSLSWIPPATGLNFSVWAIVCLVFNSLIKKRKPDWWGKYTMTLSAGLDSGLAIGVVVIFFGVIFPGWMKGFSWWGTEVFKQGCDWHACPFKTLKPGETFD
ncbi:MAG: hypothetical protein Q9220_007733 [cf. Caloplaca sp. 1 TL-2023]